MGENERRLVGYRVRLDGLYLTDARGLFDPSVTNATRAHLYADKGSAKERLSICNDEWRNGAKIVAVYRRSKAGAK